MFVFLDISLTLFIVAVPPMMTVPSQLEGATIGGNVSLRCKSEAFPASINYWVRGDRGETVTSGPRVRAETQVNNHITHMRLDIMEVREQDITSYRCVAKNSLGETDGKIRLYGEVLNIIHGNSRAFYSH